VGATADPERRSEPVSTMPSVARYLTFAIVVAVAAVCAYLLRADLSHLSFAPVARAWDVVALAAILSLLNYLVRIIRWRQYLARLGHALSFRFTALTYVAGFAFTISPGKVGEVARARYYSPLGIRLTDVAGVFFVERLMDLLAMLVLTTLILAAAPSYQIAAWTAAGVGVLCLAGLLLLPWNSFGQRLASSERIPRRLARLCAAGVQTLSAARALLTPRVLLGGFGLSLLAWGFEGVGLWTLGAMVPGAHLGLAVGVGIYAIAVSLGALSFMPGGLGGTEVIMTALLAAQGLHVADALLITLVCRLVTLWFAVCIGWIAVFALRQRLVEVPASW
jgi:uncharacterized protein (TIRG00374 family)